MLDFAWVIEFSKFRIIRLVWLPKFLSMPVFWGVGIEEGVEGKLLLGLSSTPVRWVIVNNLLGDYFRIWNWPMRGSCLNSPFTALMMPMMAKTNRRSHAKPNAMPTMPASA